MPRSDIPLCFAANYFDRLKGLFGFKGEEVVLVIIPCNQSIRFFLTDQYTLRFSIGGVLWLLLIRMFHLFVCAVKEKRMGSWSAGVAEREMMHG